MKTPGYVARVAENLEREPLADLLRLTAVVVENAREFFARLDRTGEIDAVYKPFVRELIRRSFELEPGITRPRGNA
jgi:hypothetical protein